MKQLIAILAIVVLGIISGGIILGFSNSADNLGTEGDGMLIGVVTEEGAWGGHGGHGGGGPGGPTDPDEGDPDAGSLYFGDVDYGELGVVTTFTAGPTCTGTLYDNGDLIITGSGTIVNYFNYPDSPLYDYVFVEPLRPVHRVWINEGITRIGEHNYDDRQISLFDGLMFGVLSIPNTVTTIDTNQFFYGSLLNVIIPDSVISVGEFCFCDNYELETVVLSNLMTVISKGCFWACENLTSVAIPDGVERIESSAFRECTSLESITLPSSLTSLAGYVFKDCSSLSTVYFEGNAPTVTASTFANCSTELTIYYKEGAVGFTNPWNGYPTASY